MAYVAVCKALYDYAAQTEDELTISEDDLLFVLENEDPEWWKAKLKTPGDRDAEGAEGPTGLVPRNYVEEAEPLRVSKALYDYEAQNDEELSIAEDDLLNVYDVDGLWLLVRKHGADGTAEGNAGYVPANYVDEASADDSEAATAPSEHEEAPASPTAVAPTIPVITSPPPNNEALKADGIQMWPVSLVDAKKKKKKGTLGIGNGSIFFASESDKTPVQKYPVASVTSHNLEKGKHLHIELSSISEPLHFHTGSKDVGEEIIAKLESSKAVVASSGTETLPAETPRAIPPPPAAASPPPAAATAKKSVSFLPPPSRRSASSSSAPPMDEEEQEEEEPAPAPASAPADGETGEPATALYGFEAQGDDELGCTEGEAIWVIDRVSSDDWWKCRNASGQEGVVPASYVELADADAPPPSTAAADEAAEREAAGAEAAAAAAAAAAAEEKKARAAADAERRRKEERAAEAAKQAGKRRREEEARRRREREEEEARHKVADEVRKNANALPSPPDLDSRPSSQDSKRAGETQARRGQDRSSSGSKSRPNPAKTRIWHDRSAQFKVEAEFLGFHHGKIRLHKLNGVVIEVPVEKMSNDDIRYIEKATSRKLMADEPPLSPSQANALRAQQVQSSRSASSSQRDRAHREHHPQRKNVDWFEFFLNAGCEMDDCTRYAAAFERDKMDETILPDVEPSVLRSLGLREGDIIRVTKHIEKKYGASSKQSAREQREQMKRDEELARKLQDEEARSPPPNLFTNADGSLKNQRRGRPTTNRQATAPVDPAALVSVGDQLKSTSSPPPSTPAASPAVATQPPRRSSSTVPVASGFDDDAWTVRPSSRTSKPSTPAPPQPSSSTAAAPTPSPAPAAAAATSSPAPPTPPPKAVAKSPDEALFEKLAAMRPPSAPAVQVQQTGINSPGANGALSPSPVTFMNNGMGAVKSTASLSALQAQQTGMPGFNPNAPRGPLAPVPQNQPLLNPLIPTNTGIGPFVPTRTGIGAAEQQPQPTGMGGMNVMQSPFISVSSPMGMGMTGAMTGIQSPSMPVSSPMGMTGGGMTGFQSPSISVSSPMVMGMTGGGMGGSSFNAFSAAAQSPQPPQMSIAAPQPANSQSGDQFQPSNVFAQMKTGNFGKDPNSTPQNSDKYDALRPQPTGFAPGFVQPPGQQGGFQQPQPTGFGGFGNGMGMGTGMGVAGFPQQQQGFGGPMMPQQTGFPMANNFQRQF